MKVNGMEYDDTHIAMFLEKLFWCSGEGPQSTQRLLEKLAYGDNVVIANEFHEETLDQVVELKSEVKYLENDFKNVKSDLFKVRKSLQSEQDDNREERKKSKNLENECNIYANQIAEYERICGLVNLWEKRPKKDTSIPGGIDLGEYDQDSVWDPDEYDEIEF